MILSVILAAAPTVQVWASVDEAPAKAGWAYVKRGQRVTLVARPAGGEPVDVEWFQLEPTVEALDNTSPSFHFEPVRYQANELPGCRGQRTCAASVRPTVLPVTEGLEDVGTMAFQVQVTFKDGSTARSPGLEATVSGGLSSEVMRVVVRLDDTLLGYATELFNTPYIFGSAGADGKNQSDLLIGSDCADLAVYARRRMGFSAAYTNSYSIDRQAPPLGKQVPVQAGDVLHFPSSRHVALLYRDNVPLGVLDETDLILHTCWAPPRVQALKGAACTSTPARVLRFPTKR